MKPSVQKNLDSILSPDERVIWQSETKPFGILDGKEGKKVLRQWVVSSIAAAVLAVLIALYGNATVTVRRPSPGSSASKENASAEVF